MAYTSIHKLTGDPDDLLHRKRTVMDPVVREVAPDYGAVLSITLKLPDGLMTINVWDSPEQAAAFTQLAEIQAAQRASGLPMPASFERFPKMDMDVYRALTPSA